MINEVNQATLYSTYSDYKFLTIKNPNNTLSDSDLLRVAYHLRNIIGFSVIIDYQYEWGKQHQRHIHLIIKKSILPDIPLCSKKYKLQKLKYLEVVPFSQDTDKPGIIEHTISTSSCLWHISKFNNAQHFKHVITNYLKKEQINNDSDDGSGFIDDDNQPKTPPFIPLLCPLYGE